MSATKPTWTRATAQTQCFLLARGDVRAARTLLKTAGATTSQACTLRFPPPVGIDLTGGSFAQGLIKAAAAAHTTSSCEPVPPEQPIAPMILPFSISGIPPRDATTSSRLNTYL